MTNSSFSRLEFSREQVETVLEGLNNGKGPGDDGISNYFFRNTAATIAIPLMIIFNASLAAGVFPSFFKQTIIHPIFKSGDQHDVKNYRPISILSAISKVFEKLVHKALLFHVTPYLSESQHITNLMEYVTFICEALDRKEQIDSIYLDLSKAFDKVCACKNLSCQQRF